MKKSPRTDASVLHLDRFDEARFAVLPDAHDLPSLADDAAALGIAAEVGCIGRGIELEGIVDVGLGAVAAVRCTRPNLPRRAASASELKRSWSGSPPDCIQRIQ